MLDGEKRDDKILAVPNGDPRYTEYHDLKDLLEHILKEIAYLFETYKVLEGKTVKVLGWGGSAGREIGDHTMPEAVRWEGPLSFRLGALTEASGSYFGL